MLPVPLATQYGNLVVRSIARSQTTFKFCICTVDISPIPMVAELTYTNGILDATVFATRTRKTALLASRKPTRPKFLYGYNQTGVSAYVGNTRLWLAKQRFQFQQQIKRLCSLAVRWLFVRVKDAADLSEVGLIKPRLQQCLGLFSQRLLLGYLIF